jgi:peptidoglycan hydrolase-like protein with peptidoglycan-binding domain
MTIHFPDISSYQAGISLKGAPAVAVKVTEGTGYANPDYGPAKGRAASAGAFFFAYHFLSAGNGSGQAAYCFSKNGTIPLMLDFEPSGSRPSLNDAVAFLDAYKARGGICKMTYLPNWYWQQIGRPSLAPLSSRGHTLVSSNYTSYTDAASGAGWQPYGGMTPGVWQYTDRKLFNGRAVDFNAYRGTIAQFRVMAGSGVTPPPVLPVQPGGKAPLFPYPAGHYLGQPSSNPVCHSGYYGGPDATNVHAWQTQMAKRGWKISADGQFGPGSETVARGFQQEKGLGVDGKVGKDTWAAAWTTPVTG